MVTSNRNCNGNRGIQALEGKIKRVEVPLDLPPSTSPPWARATSPSCPARWRSRLRDLQRPPRHRLPGAGVRVPRQSAEPAGKDLRGLRRRGQRGERHRSHHPEQYELQNGLNGIGDAAKEAQEVRLNPFWAAINTAGEGMEEMVIGRLVSIGGPGFFISMPQGSEDGQTSEGQGSESDYSDEAAL